MERAVRLFSRFPDGIVVAVPVREVEGSGTAHFDDFADHLVVFLEARVQSIEIRDVEQ
ncbi:hypothetical protein SDC9_150573 [bioreactor metagenome]|uniref:Uncharacterized protein n=1 Tax=bioreactor metagenome TaxID=1076179 RepID=A0A645EPH1_9ZZZZ